VQALAVDISLAALLGEDVYNFGELLLHPIVSTCGGGCVEQAAITSTTDKRKQRWRGGDSQHFGSQGCWRATWRSHWGDAALAVEQWC
jgi:hypothetical protein